MPAVMCGGGTWCDGVVTFQLQMSMPALQQARVLVRAPLVVAPPAQRSIHVLHCLVPTFWYV